jgi:hypothetical protein
MAKLDTSDFILFVGLDLKKELPVFNARLRALYLRESATFASVGASSNFPTASLGLGISDLMSFISGRHPLAKNWAKAASPKLVLSATLFDTK